MTLSDVRTDREKAIDAFRAHGEQTTVLQLSNCSTALTEADFRRVSPRGLHIETWSRDGEFYKIIPGRDPLSLARLPFYYLLFRTPESALAYQKNASRLSKLTALHQSSDSNSAVQLPKGFLEEGEDITAVISSFVLHPQGHALDLRTIMQPYQRALRALIGAGGYSPIVPNVDDKGKKIHRVLLHIDGYEPSHWDLWQILSRHAHARGLMWPFRNDSAGLRKLRDCINLKTNSKLQAASQMNPWAANSSNPQFDLNYEDAQISSFLGLEKEESGTEQQQQEDDGDHRAPSRAISTASSASAVSSSRVRELSSPSRSPLWPSSSERTDSNASTRIITQKAVMPKVQMPCGTTSGTRSALLSCASKSALSSTSDQPAQRQKPAKTASSSSETPIAVVSSTRPGRSTRM